jgi:diadenosine tetraphosphatase ApaH/serine/threonine PP2A family protein phosphatase
MTTVFISDIHGNLEALEAVLGVVDTYRPDRIYCLEHVRRRCSVVLLGNHDAAASGGPEIARFNIHARVAAEWTSRVLTREHREFLQKLPMEKDDQGFHCVHASPATPRDWEYLLDRFDAEPQFAYFTAPVCFIGHTHQPAIFMADPAGCRSLPVGTMTLDPQRRYIVNVGSVGQPRDRDPRACFAVYHEAANRIEYVRVPYAIEGAQQKIRAARLPEVLAARLATGE